MGDDEALRRRVRLMRPPPDEAQLRQRYAVEAEAMGRGGAGAVARAAGCPGSTARGRGPWAGSQTGLGRAARCGARDVGADEGWAGVSRDTAHLAVASPRSWWDRMGGEGYPGADGLVAACGGGGPNGSRDRPREREPRLSCDRRRMGAGAATFRPAPPGGAGPGTAPSPRSPATGAAGRPPGSLEVIAGPVASTTTSGGRGRVRGRPAPARGRDQGHRRGDGRPRHPRGGLPRRVELCHKASRRG